MVRQGRWGKEETKEKVERKRNFKDWKEKDVGIQTEHRGKGGRQIQKVKDEKQCLWKGSMGIEGEIILKYDNEAEKKKRNHYGKRISPSCPSLCCIQIGHLQKRKD